MSDLERLTRNLLRKLSSKYQIIERLKQEYLDFKNISLKEAELLSNAVYEECVKNETSSLPGEILNK